MRCDDFIKMHLAKSLYGTKQIVLHMSRLFVTKVSVQVLQSYEKKLKQIKSLLSKVF